MATWPNRPLDWYLNALTSADWRYRRQAALALGHFDSPEVVEPLCQALADSHPEVRRNAAHALGQRHDGRAIDALLAAVPDTDPDTAWEVNTYLLKALGDIGDQRAVPGLIALLTSPNSVVSNGAADALRRLGDPSALVPLLAAFRHGCITSNSIVCAIGPLCAPSVYPIAARIWAAIEFGQDFPSSRVFASSDSAPPVDRALEDEASDRRRQRQIDVTSRCLPWLVVDTTATVNNPDLPDPVRAFFGDLRRWYSDEVPEGDATAEDFETWWRTKTTFRVGAWIVGE